MTRKTTVTLDGVPLAAATSFTWRLQTGVQPYRTIAQVHTSAWGKLKNRRGKPLTLEIINGEGKHVFRELYILHTVASDSPHRVSFVLVDRRWKWPYRLITRDYNITRKSGNRSYLYEKVPVENLVDVDIYNFKPYSLKNGRKWTAREALEDTLREITDDGGSRYFVESFPVNTEYSLQNISMRDQGDVALGRLLSYIPGADVYVDPDGLTRVINSNDRAASETLLNRRLPPLTYDGETVVMIDREPLRPQLIDVHYVREVEFACTYTDDYSSPTRTPPDADTAYLDNVIQTVDPLTLVDIFNPETKRTETVNVPQGTWVEASALLSAWNTDRPSGSLPWTFDTIRRHWLKGDLEGVLGGGGSRGIPDLDENGNVMLRVQSLRQNLFQTFRINSRIMDRSATIQAVRVAPMDPITGARSHAAVWGQACIIPSVKGQRMSARRDPERASVFRNIDSLPGAGENLKDVRQSPARVNIIDRDQGIFRVEWVQSPYGTVDSIIPRNLTGESGSITSVTRNLARQDTEPMGAGIQVENGSNGIFLSETMEMRCIMTMIPGAPNNKAQFHVERIAVDDILPQLATGGGVSGGTGPILEVFVPPGEAMARFAWTSDELAEFTFGRLIGASDDVGLPVGQRLLTGYTFTNELSEVVPDSRSVATEMYSAFVDNLQGRATTALPSSPLVLRGNVSSASVQVAGAPSAKTQAVHEFPGQQKPISRYALLPESVRRIVLGIVPFGGGDK